MRVSVFFYKPLDAESIIYNSLRKLYFSHNEAYIIGMRAGFGVENLPWHDAHTLAVKTAVTVLKCDCEGLFAEMRIIVQADQPSRSLIDRP